VLTPVAQMEKRVRRVWRTFFLGNLKLARARKIHELEKRLKDAALEGAIKKNQSAFFPRAMIY
jgi:hypothetical protein